VVEGTAFGRYRLVDLLGRGGMGEVWRAFDTVTERVVALKALPAGLADDQVFQERFRREAKAAAGLDDPHVVPIYDYGEIDGRLFVTMRLIKGEDVQAIIQRGPLPPTRAVGIVEQIASALHAAHRVGLVHRDVKPSNVLVAEDDFAYLIDFGIARAAGETGLTNTGATIGTWAYMAPERFEHDAADARIDVYALTCVLFQALTGQLPFPGTGLQQIAMAHMVKPPPQPSTFENSVPREMDAVISTGMAKELAQRFATTRDLAQAARAALTTPRRQPSRPAMPPTAPPPPAMPPTVVGDVRAPRPEQVSPSAPTRYESPQPQRMVPSAFASRTFSALAYAPEQIFLVLSVAGLSAFEMAPRVGLGVGVAMLILIASYAQNAAAYPSGGGDYELITTNLGRTPGLMAASALLVDYALTVAVSMSSAMANVGAAVPFVNQREVLFAVVAIVLLAAVNLRGIRESGVVSAIVVYAFVICIFVMVSWGLFQIHVLAHVLRAESADFHLHSAYGDVVGIAMVFLVARAFTLGSSALTGVQAISSVAPANRKLGSRNPAATLALVGVIAIALLMGIIILAKATGVQSAASPREQLFGAPAGYHQKTLIAQLADVVFHDFPLGLLLVVLVTALVLVLAANTAFKGFPALGSVLARDGFLPRQLQTRSDRWNFSNGILGLAAVVFVVAFGANVTALLQLYVVSAMVVITLSQIGMVRHWTRLLRSGTELGAKMKRSRAIATLGVLVSASVLIVALVTMSISGAWLAVVAMAVLFAVMMLVGRKDRVSRV
jgi:serine/threonine protein kinase/amino acid transporter